MHENSGRQISKEIKGGQLGEKVDKKLGEKVVEKKGEKVGESLGEIHKLSLCHMWYVTWHTWLGTHDIWHGTCDMLWGMSILTISDFWYFEKIKEKNHWMSLLLI